MLRIAFSQVHHGIINLQSCQALSQQIRYYKMKIAKWPFQVKVQPKKPAWLGPAKTKRFKVIEEKFYPEDELQEIERLYKNYYRHYDSLSMYFRQEYDKISDVSELAKQRQIQEEEDHNRLMAENMLENQCVASEREERAKDRQELVLKQLKEQEQIYLEKTKQIREEAEDRIRKEKAIAHTFTVRHEQLDKLIDDCLDSQIVDYNFAVDLKGKIYQGKLTRPQAAEPRSSQRNQKEEENLSDVV